MENILKISRRLSAFLILLVPLIVILRSPSGFPYPSENSTYSDITITHFPNTFFLKSQLSTNKVLPFWSPSILSGYPFVANPLSGIWYPPGWLAMIFPLPLGFNLVAALHLAMGGLGMFLFLRGEGLGRKASFFGAVAFEGMPKIFAHYGAGHITLIYALSWTPWLLWSGKKSLNKRTGIDILSIMFLSLIVLADPRWIPYAGLLWVSNILINHFQIVDGLQEPGHRSIMKYMSNLGSKLLRLTGELLAVFLITSPMLLPLMEYVNISTRSHLDINDLFIFSLPTARLVGFVFPEFGGFHEFMIYPGSIVVLLVFLAILRRGKKLRDYFWIIYGFIAIIFGVGALSPLTGILNSVPGLNLLRVPSRAFFVTSLSMSILAAFIVDSLESNKPLILSKSSKLIYLSFISLVVFMGLGVWLLEPINSGSFLYGSIAFLFMFFWVELRNGVIFQKKIDEGANQRDWRNLKKFICSNYWYIGLLGLLTLDLGIINSSLVTFRNPEEILAEKSKVAQLINQDQGIFRVYSPSYSLPQSTAIIHGVELADGVDPLQLTSYVDFMEDATGIKQNGYSVTLPPFEPGNPKEDNRFSVPDAELLGRLNVKYVVSEFDLDVDGLTLIATIESSRVYENQFVFPRAWVEILGSETGYEGVFSKAADITTYTPNKIVLQASGPGDLILSEIAYPGWEAFVDGEKIEIEVAYDVLRSVSLDEGVHQVTMLFKPSLVYLGLALMTMGILSILIVNKKLVKRIG